LIFFSAIVSGLGLFSSYAGFFDSVKLIKQHGKLLLERATRGYPGADFEISVVEQFPSLPDPNDFGWRRIRKMFGPEADELWRGFMFAGRERSNRDAFFWFLLIFNILLLAALGILVEGAVVKTYFH
jgi:hypothetical protein